MSEAYIAKKNKSYKKNVSYIYMKKSVHIEICLI